MDNSNSSDKVLENLVENKEAEMLLRNSENEFAVPGTPVILPGRGIIPNEGEYLNDETDSGVTSDKAEIELLKAKNKMDVIYDGLLGKFDYKGVYRVTPDIGKELLNMVKVITRELDPDLNPKFVIDGKEVPNVSGVIYCESLSSFGGIGNFKFAVQTHISYPKAESELFLLEKIVKNSGMVEKTNIYSVATYRDRYDITYQAKMYEFFNIINKAVSISKAEEERLLFGWAYRRKLFLQTIKELGHNEFMMAEADLLNAKLETLANMGAFGVQVLQSFQALQEKAKSIIKKGLNAKDNNDLLDMAIESHKGKHLNNVLIYYKNINPATKIYAKKISQIEDSHMAAAQIKITPTAPLPGSNFDSSLKGKATYKPGKFKAPTFAPYAPPKSKKPEVAKPKAEAPKAPTQTLQKPQASIQKPSNDLPPSGAANEEIVKRGNTISYEKATTPLSQESNKSSLNPIPQSLSRPSPKPKNPNSSYGL